MSSPINNWDFFIFAETVRFELTIEFPRCQFSKLVPSTTQPRLLDLKFSTFCHFFKKLLWFRQARSAWKGRLFHDVRAQTEQSNLSFPVRRLYRLTVRTCAFQAQNPGSIPGRVTNRNFRRKWRLAAILRRKNRRHIFHSGRLSSG